MEIMMEHKNSILALLALGATMLTGCSDDDETNRLPIASNVTLGSFSGQSAIAISSSSLISASSDADGDTLTLENVTLTNGSGTLTEANGEWSYTPSTTELGDVSFQYTVSDGEGTSSASATLTVIDSSKTQVSNAQGVTVYGYARDANTRQFIPGLTVTLKVNGSEFTALTSSSAGGVTFLNAPVDTEYFVTITDPNGVYAPSFYSDVTSDFDNDIDGNPIIEPLSDLIDFGDIYPGVTTSITVLDISGAAVEGLQLYYDSNVLAAANGQAVSIQGNDVKGIETAGVYSFSLPDNGNAIDIKVQQLVDINGVKYEPYRGSLNNNVISSATAGKSMTYYVNSLTNAEFIIVYHLLDEDGHAFTQAGPVLVVDNANTGMTENWYPVVDSQNEYYYTVDASNMSDIRMISPMDIDGDGFTDYSVALNSDEALNVQNQIGRGSFDENKQLTLVYPLSETKYDESIQAEIVSNDDNFQSNGIAEIIIAFDRPIDLIHTPTLSVKTIDEKEVTIALESPADLYTEELVLIAMDGTTDQGETAISLNAQNQYEYTDKDGNIATLDLGRDDTDKVVSTYATNLQSVDEIRKLTDTEYVLSANNSLLTITLDASSLMADHNYTFELAVKGKLSSNPVAFMSFSKMAKSSATATLETLTVDNFDFGDTESYDVTDPTAENYLANQKLHTDKYRAINVGYDGNAATSEKAQVRYLKVNDNGDGSLFDTLDDFNIANNIDPDRNKLYLVSKAKLEGSIQVVSQVEKDFVSDELSTETVTLADAFYRLDLVDQNIEDDGDLSDLTLINGTKMYLFDKPSNHTLDDSGIDAVYGIDVASGASIASEGVYYVYALPLSLQTSGYIESVTLNVNLTANGAGIVGEMSYPVK